MGEGVDAWLTQSPSRFTPSKVTHPLSRRLGGTWGRPGGVRKTLPQRGFEARTVQHAASRHTDYAILYVIQS